MTKRAHTHTLFERLFGAIAAGILAALFAFVLYTQQTRQMQRNDEEYTYVSAWQYTGEQNAPVLHKEPLEFEYVKLATRSYK